MPLTETALKNLKPAEKAYNKADGGGLRIAILPNGTKTWRLDYRYLGTRKTLTIGPYPTMTLAEARARREDAKRLLVKGVDPSVEKKVQRQQAEANQQDTFGAVVTEFIDRLRALGRAEPTIVKNKWMLEEIAKPLAKRPIREITAPEVFQLLQGVERTGRRDTAVATRAAISRVFRLAVLSGKADTDPTYALRGALLPPDVKSHAAIIDEEGLKGLLRAMNGYTGWASLKGLIKMQAYVFTRPGETRTMRLEEIDFERKVWTIPAEKAKMRRPQDVPLSRQALAIIEDMRPLMRKGYVFPSMMTGKDILSENSINSALRRMGFTHDEHTAHGFRSTASSLLNASKKFPVDAIEAQLAHLDTNKVRRIYNRHDYWEERVEMMQWWADYLDKLTRQI
jgi:integrase